LASNSSFHQNLPFAQREAVWPQRVPFSPFSASICIPETGRSCGFAVARI
jgi:hypothetical protein